MRDPAVAAFAKKRGIPVHLLRDGSDLPACRVEGPQTVLSSAARADVTCNLCQVGLPERKACGRVDDHNDHPWRRNQVIRDGVLVPAVDYWCPGTPVLEGGARA